MIKSSDYKNIIENQSVKQDKDINLQMNNSQMSKLTIKKKKKSVNWTTYKNDCFRK